MQLLLSCNGFGNWAVQKPLHSVPEADLVVDGKKYRGVLTVCPFGMASQDIQVLAHPHEPQIFFRFETSYESPISDHEAVPDNILSDIWECKFTFQLDSNDLITPTVMGSLTRGGVCG